MVVADPEEEVAVEVVLVVVEEEEVPLGGEVEEEAFRDAPSQPERKESGACDSNRMTQHHM